VQLRFFVLLGCGAASVGDALRQCGGLIFKAQNIEDEISMWF
jgi:hypothetical protein